jgi:ribosomal protein S18 acetylase RimI-like enzyme
MLRDLHNKEQVCAAIEGSWYALFQRFACRSQSEVYEDPYLKRVYTGIPWGFGGIFATTLPQDLVKTAIQDSITYFEAHHHPFRWYTSPITQPRDLGQQLIQHGFTEGSPTPALAVNIDTVSATPSIPDQLTIQSVSNLDMLYTWLQIWLDCNGLSKFLPMLFEIEKTLGFDDAQVQRLIGYWQRRPVASSMGFYAYGVTRINNVATHPDARRRGIATAITLMQLHKAHEAGYSVAVLYPSPLAVSLYHRIGFREYYPMISYRFGTQLYRPH